MERRVLSSIPTLLFCLGIARAEDLAALDSQRTSDRPGPAQSDAPVPEGLHERQPLSANRVTSDPDVPNNRPT